MKRTLIVAALIIFGMTQVKAQKSEIYVSGGKAINGYDAVAFFTQSKPVKGSDSFSFEWQGAKWLFANAEDLAAFKADPEKYAPQYGGYCAYGTSQGHKAPTKAETWTVLNNKLYFNYNKQVKELWTKDRDSLIIVADKKWPEVKAQ
ncbi:YHS domain-containing (seleno)protein [Mucilaginibacter ginsenosidivorans]|uniref:YHS domain protein n=1 Tax=Mucilaginibacter ginsenosidivorans TaxID=398053 RepID=A0A5B8UZN0_9SPHI|nr:YHS domain-containing (seleno)protein [Mucilaginibacter ginsenosidivorans]QEC64043.1 YHS domain protein [Mucilaginibacter ginsenosidivorans]